MNYLEAQKAMFEHLWNKRQEDANFTFSVRQSASKNSETNYFIGTERSGYFSFTCWDIIATFPGAAADLTDFIIFQTRNDTTWQIKFQYFMAKSAAGEQNEANLALGPILLKAWKDAEVSVVAADEANKMLTYTIQLPSSTSNTPEELANAFEALYNLVAPPVDKAIEYTKQKFPNWNAERYTQDKFSNLITKMHDRIKRYANATPKEIAALPDEIEFNQTINDQVIPLNTILYGPPGTGKTYNTIDKAVAIADADFYAQNSSNRSELTRRFNELLIKDFKNLEGQIAFCTFHQSMSYEDFVEGIKPYLVELEADEASIESNRVELETGTHLKYSIKDGIFKIIARMASDAMEQTEAPSQQTFSLGEPEFNQALFYKMSLGDTQKEEDKEIYDYCMANNYVALGWGGNIDYTNTNEREIQKTARESGEDKTSAEYIERFINYIKPGNYIVISKGNFRFRGIGKVVGNYEYNPDLRYHHLKKVEWVLKDVDLPVVDIYNKNFSQQSLYKLHQQWIKREFFVPAPAPKKAAVKKEPLNYVLIIDEINRGNVSAIFGELITLIEDDKRTGKDEALTITLPYSKKIFSIPPNLYIIGTMNTADRSVEALDTALRRRFVFEEKGPQPNLLSPQEMIVRLYNKYPNTSWDNVDYRKEADSLYYLLGIDRSFEKPWSDNGIEAGDEEIKELSDDLFSGVNLKKLLSVINQRLAVLLSKDHTIGHAWLINVFNLENLRQAFQNKILPLLQEYFYNNYAKLDLVLGDRFIIQNKEGAITFAKSAKSPEAASDYEETITYTLADMDNLSIEDFKSVYA